MPSYFLARTRRSCAGNASKQRTAFDYSPLPFVYIVLPAVVSFQYYGRRLKPPYFLKREILEDRVRTAMKTSKN
jgi:hypothetical protein